MPAPFDPRAIANELLDLADANEIPITNLTLQKLLYFCHAKYLLAKGEPLIKGSFEAWQYGPVQPLVYESFKACGREPIQTRAVATDIITRESRFLPPIDSSSAKQFILGVLVTFGGMSPGRLVDITHAENGPWHFVVKRAGESVSLGMKIPDSLIVERFKFHKVTVSSEPRSGEPHEDAPLTRN